LKEILNDHYKKYGRSFFSRYDYEEVDSAAANEMVATLNKHIADGALASKSFKSASTGQGYTVSKTFNFDYTDPIDSSIAKNQGQVIQFSDGSRVVFRLSGTGSQGATVRMYVERYTKDTAEFGKETSQGLQGLIEVALQLSHLKEYLGRDEPTVITVSPHGLSLCQQILMPIGSNGKSQLESSHFRPRTKFKLQWQRNKVVEHL
jgi:phosphoglucomutase